MRFISHYLWVCNYITSDTLAPLDIYYCTGKFPLILKIVFLTGKMTNGWSKILILFEIHKAKVKVALKFSSNWGTFVENLSRKKGLFSVGGFETETSNFALNGCLRVSTIQKFDARSNGGLRMIPSTLCIGCFHGKTVFLQLFYIFSSIFHSFIDVSRQKNVFSAHCASILSRPFDQAWNFL